MVNLAMLGIVVLTISAVALTAWWSAYCHRRLCGR